MDIGSLLAEADREVGEAPSYEDNFEALDEDDKQHEPLSAREILRNAAQLIDKEEKYEAKQLFKEAAGEVKELVDQIQDDQEGKDQSDRDALKILIDASKEVTALHKQAGVEIVSPDRRKEEIDIDAGLESDDDEEEFDDSLSQQLLHACHQGNINKVEKLLDRSGVNLLFIDRHGWTPLHWAASKGHTDIMVALIKHRKVQRRKMKKFIEAQDKLAGWTPLHAASVAGQKYAVEVLLEYGASKSKKDFMKEIPADVVGKSKHNKAILELLSVEVEFESKQDR